MSAEKRKPPELSWFEEYFVCCVSRGSAADLPVGHATEDQALDSTPQLTRTDTGFTTSPPFGDEEEQDFHFFTPRSSCSSEDLNQDTWACVASTSLRRPRMARSISGGSDAGSQPGTSRAARLRATLSRSLSRALTLGTKRPDFNGWWTCVSTWGLEDFLRACGASEWQVICASNAPWPQWEFQQTGEHFLYINHNSLCNLREEFEVGGPEYIAYDTRRKALTCSARWVDNILVIDRHGDDGQFRENRSITGDGFLKFSLMALKPGMEGCSWGRTFKRKS